MRNAYREPESRASAAEKISGAEKSEAHPVFEDPEIDLPGIRKLKTVGESGDIDQMLRYAETEYRFTPEELNSLRSVLERAAFSAAQPKGGAEEYGEEKNWTAAGSSSMADTLEKSIGMILLQRGQDIKREREKEKALASKAQNTGGNEPFSDKDVEGMLKTFEENSEAPNPEGLPVEEEDIIEVRPAANDEKAPTQNPTTYEEV